MLLRYKNTAKAVKVAKNKKFTAIFKKKIGNSLDLHNTKLRGIDLDSANLRGASLYSADLSNANLVNVNL